MVRKPMTLEEIKATHPTVDLAKIAATTEEDIRRHQIEDGEDPDAPPPPFRLVPNVRAIRARLQMTQEAFAKAIGVPVDSAQLGAIPNQHGPGCSVLAAGRGARAGRRVTGAREMTRL